MATRFERRTRPDVPPRDDVAATGGSNGDSFGTLATVAAIHDFQPDIDTFYNEWLGQPLQ